MKTLGEKKQYYAEYQGRCKKAEKETRRKNARLHREDFRALLTTLAEASTLTSRSKWRAMQGEFEADERFTRMDPRDAEDVFEDYMDEYVFYGVTPPCVHHCAWCHHSMVVFVLMRFVRLYIGRVKCLMCDDVMNPLFFSPRCFLECFLEYCVPMVSLYILE